jgi:O-antigen/teichoic acid export membrane protein
VEQLSAFPGLQRSALWAAADQTLFGLSNLGLHLLLARWLDPADYGAFGAAFALLLLSGGVEGTLVVEPMLLHGPRLRDRFAVYLRVLLEAHLVLVLLAMSVCAGAGGIAWMLDQPELAASFLATSGALPGVLTAWLLRRVAYVCFATRLAAIVGALQLLLVLGGAALLHTWGSVTPASAMLLLGAAHVVAALVLAWSLGVLRQKTHVPPEFRRKVLRDHWRFGRWMLASSPFEWLFANFYYFALPALSGLAAAGTLGAMMNFVRPMGQM